MKRLLPLLLAFAAFPAFPAFGQPMTLSGPVTHVRDGDTIEIVGQPIRLSGLHAPELGEPGGKEARTWMIEATAGKVVTCHLDGHRTHDRKVGVCYVGGKDLAVGLILAGLARDCPRYSGGRYRMHERAEAVRFGLPAYCRLR